MLLGFSALLIGVSALALCDIYRLSTVSARIVGFFVFCWAHIVVVGQTVGALDMLRPLPYVITQLIVCVVCIGVWYGVRRTELSTYPAHLRAMRAALRTSMGEIWRTARRYPVLVLLTLAVGIASVMWVVQFTVGVPNSWDAMHYHLPRVGYWIQHGNLYPWEALNERQVSFPMVSSLGILWLTLFGGTERLYGAVQWTSAWIALPAIYGIVRLLGGTRPQAWFGAVVYLTLPSVALLASSTLNDLVIATFVIMAVYLFLLGVRTASPGALMISAFSVGLGFGSKSTMFFVIPGLAAAAVLLWLSAPRRRFGLLFRWSIACALSIAILGSYAYINNLQHYGNPLGSGGFVNYHVGAGASRLALLAHNTLRYGYLFIDVEGFPAPVSNALHQGRTAVVGAIAQVLNLNLNSDQTRRTVQRWEFGVTRVGAGVESQRWFGLHGFVLIVAGVISGLIMAFRRRNALLLSLIVIAGTYAALQSMLEPFSLNIARYFLAAVVVIMPLIGLLFPDRRLRGWNIVLIGILAVGVYLMFQATTYSELRPFSRPNAKPFWEQTRIQQQMGFDPRVAESMVTVEACVPLDARLGLMYNIDNTHEYIYFGAGFTRTLTQFRPIRDTAETRPPINDYTDIPFLLARQGTADYVPDDFVLWQPAGYYDLYIRADMTEQALCPAQPTVRR